MMLIRQMMQKKGGAIWSVRPQHTVFEALELMAAKNIGAVLVMEDDELVGIFSERDYARKVILLDKSSKSTMVGDIMTPHVICVTPQNTIDHCLSLMTEKRIRHLPILENERVIGVVSIGDLVKEKIALQENTIAQLENYITSGEMIS